MQFPADVQIYAAQVHAHYRGYASKLTAIYPDGKEEILLNMPHYDFNWQREYIFKDLIDMPAGTKLVADYWYDNSENNKALHGDTTKALHQPGRRRSSGATSRSRRCCSPPSSSAGKTRRPPSRAMTCRRALQQTQLLTMADDNRDGKLQEAELRRSRRRSEE